MAYNKQIALELAKLSEEIYSLNNQAAVDGFVENHDIYESATFVEKENVQAIVLKTKMNNVVVVFRGTELSERGDVEADANFFLTKFDGDTQVHSGFKGDLEDIWQALLPKIEKHQAPQRVYFTGHSLGGALATLAIFRYKLTHPQQDVASYTIGSPRVGDKEFKRKFNRLILDVYRIKNDRDAVTTMPPYVPLPLVHSYHHIGHKKVLHGPIYQRFLICFYLAVKEMHGSETYVNRLEAQAQASSGERKPIFSI